MDNTLKEVNVWRSIKRFWINGLTDYSVYFGRIVTSPSFDENQWVSIQTADMRPGQVSTVIMTAFMFSKNDTEFDALYALRDTVLDLLEPRTINLYNTYEDPWEFIGGMTVYVNFQSKPVPVIGKSYMSYIETLLKWGAVWS